MSLVPLSDSVAILTVDSIPARLVWHGVHYRVSDTPTPLSETVAHPLITHPFERIIGWRFQGTSEAGDSFVFDAEQLSQDRWRVVRVWS